MDIVINFEYSTEVKKDYLNYRAFIFTYVTICLLAQIITANFYANYGAGMISIAKIEKKFKAYIDTITNKVSDSSVQAENKMVLKNV